MLKNINLFNLKKYISLTLISLVISSCSATINEIDSNKVSIFSEDETPVTNTTDLESLDNQKNSAIPTVPQGSDPNFLTFFSNTYDGDPNIAKGFENNPDKQFIKMINEAKTDLDICAYFIDSENISNAIIEAHNRGVKVRLVLDSDTNKKQSVINIKYAGIPVVDDGGRSAFMHNKFAIVDKDTVWTGSFNLTDSASWKHSDNAIKIKSVYLAQNYLAEFEEMFVENKFGKKSKTLILNNMKNRIVRIGNKYVKTFFAPDDDVIKALVSEIEKAQTEINFMAYSFTHEKLVEAIIKKAKAGVKVSGIFEFLGATSKDGNDIFRKLAEVKADLHVYRSPNPAQSFMHHKVFIIDGKVVSTGSFNFTHSASDDNDENMLIITSTEVAGAYKQEFEKLKSRS